MTEHQPFQSNVQEGVRERVERLVGEGLIQQYFVDQAIELWQDRLRQGVVLPNGHMARPTVEDVYHAIIDPRILRHPERIEMILSNIFEMRSTNHPNRSMGLSQWDEAGQPVFGKVIIERGGGMRSIHVIDARAVQKEQRKGVLLWKP